MTTKQFKELIYYQQLPYKRSVDRKDGEGEWAVYFRAFIPQIPGCFAVGKTRNEALYNLDLAFDDYIEAQIEDGENIPEPATSKGRAQKGQIAEGLITDSIQQAESNGVHRKRNIRESKRLVSPDQKKIANTEPIYHDPKPLPAPTANAPPVPA